VILLLTEVRKRSEINVPYLSKHTQTTLYQFLCDKIQCSFFSTGHELFCLFITFNSGPYTFSPSPQALEALETVS
jgi:hypothetical protein